MHWTTYLKLSRWQEFIPWTLPLTVLGGIMAARYGEGVQLDWQLVVVFLANCLAVGYAFIINDIEDAEDDKHDAERASRNAVASGDISMRRSWTVGIAIALASLLLFAITGTLSFLVGLLTVVLGHLYSWKPIRLKALPLVDVGSHVLFLSLLLMLAPYVIYTQKFPLEVVLLMASVTLFSAYGQFYNQSRDYAADRAAGLKNTASLVGKQVIEIFSYGSIIIAFVCLLGAILLGAFPIELVGAVLLSLPIAWFFGRGRDMRGDEASDAVGEGQVQFLITANFTLLIWLAYVIANQAN